VTMTERGPGFDGQPTRLDERVWTQVYGFTPEDIGTMARVVEVPEEKVTRLIELAKFIRTMPTATHDGCVCAQKPDCMAHGAFEYGGGEPDVCEAHPHGAPE
jgi:hypothetical protein